MRYDIRVYIYIHTSLGAKGLIISHTPPSVLYPVRYSLILTFVTDSVVK